MQSSDLLRAIEELVRLPKDSLQGAELLKDIAGWDSLAMIEFTALVDEKYGIDILPEEVRKCKSVQDLIDLSQTRLTH